MEKRVPNTPMVRAPHASTAVRGEGAAKTPIDAVGGWEKGTRGRVEGGGRVGRCTQAVPAGVHESRRQETRCPYVDERKAREERPTPGKTSREEHGGKTY